MKNKFISALLAGCLAVGCIGPVSAAEINVADGNGQVPVELTTEALTFSVTLPTALPVKIEADGTVNMAGNVEIVNNSAGLVEIKSVFVEAKNNWVLTDLDTNLRAEKVNAKKFTMELLDEPVATDGNCAANSYVIPAKENNNTPGRMHLEYSVYVAPQSASLNETIADVVFTVGWASVLQGSSDSGN